MNKNISDIYKSQFIAIIIILCKISPFQNPIECSNEQAIYVINERYINDHIFLCNDIGCQCGHSNEAIKSNFANQKPMNGICRGQREYEKK